MFNVFTATTPMTKTSTSQQVLNERRRLAVKMRLQGQKIADISAIVELSAPTIIAAHKLFLSGGWPAVDVKPRGRSPGTQMALADDTLLQVRTAAEKIPPHNQPWTLKNLESHCREQYDASISGRSLGKYLSQWGLDAGNLHTLCKTSGDQLDWLNSTYKLIVEKSRKADANIFWVGRKTGKTKSGDIPLLYAHTTRGQYCWLGGSGHASDIEHLFDFLERLNRHANSDIAVILHGMDISNNPAFEQRLAKNTNITVYPHPTATTPSAPMSSDPAMDSTVNTGNAKESSITTPAQPPTAELKTTTTPAKSSNENRKVPREKRKIQPMTSLTHLQQLEAESIHIMREVIANSDKPVMLYSIGKDSAVMLHLARKAFYPAKLPFPLLHVDTGWKFQEMYSFRDQTAKDLNLELITHQNQEGVEKGVNPFTHGSALHTDIMKTQGLRQALDKHQFDIALGGARRDEEQSRAKERIFSFRSEQHRWDPKNQRPELWNLYNTTKNKGESIRVFPISNWTELDVWQYIHLEGIPIVPLYYSAQRPVVMRDGTLIMVDDDRMPMNEGEVPMIKNVRFRTLGCYPLTGAIESNATTLPEIIQEMLLAKNSERQGRMIDHDSSASMEMKKQEGYF